MILELFIALTWIYGIYYCFKNAAKAYKNDKYSSFGAYSLGVFICCLALTIRAFKLNF